MSCINYLLIQDQPNAFILTPPHHPTGYGSAHKKKAQKKNHELTPEQSIKLIATALTTTLLSFALSPILQAFSFLLTIPIFLIMAHKITN